ncbi:hypothetical protein B0T26DRAFT_641157, partial [Lasiosphaeria miniovina]
MGQYSDTVTRAQALTLKAVGLTNTQIQQVTGIPPRTLNDILDRAIKAGYEPITSDGALGRLDSSHVANAPKSGRPSKQEAIQE